MATAERVLQFGAAKNSIGPNNSVTLEKSTGLLQMLASIFGCQHRRISRPFTRQGQSYRACLGCGARTRFDLQTWKTSGEFYHEA